MNSLNWCFTLNNPLAEDEQDEPSSWGGVKYLVYQLEQGDSETVHWQGYLIMKKRSRLSAMKQLNSRAHWEPRKGNHKQARDYCMKEPRLDGPYEIGTPAEQGKRCDLLEIQAKLDAGVSASEIRHEHFANWLRYEKSFVRYAMLAKPPRDFKTNVIVYWGLPGTGKSRAAAAAAGPDAYFKPPGNKWFDNYAGQETVVFDDFRGCWFSLTVFLNLLDRYPCAVEYKGGMANFAPKTIYITSNVAPQHWYSDDNAGCPHNVLRRLDTVVQYPIQPDEHIANRDAVMYVGYHESPAPSNIL